MNAEQRIATLEYEIITKYGELSELKKELEPKKIDDYVFMVNDGQEVTLNELFESSDRMILVHNMGRQCPYCTVWADGFSDSYHRISKKIPFVVTSKETADVQQHNKDERDWQFPMVSSHENTILEDLGFLSDGMTIPGMAYLMKDQNGQIHLKSKHFFGPGDQFGMLWHVMDTIGQWNVDEYRKPE